MFAQPGNLKLRNTVGSDSSPFNTEQRFTAAPDMTALQLRSEDTLKARTQKADEFTVKSLGSESMDIQKILQDHDLRILKWEDLNDHDGAPITIVSAAVII